MMPFSEDRIDNLSPIEKIAPKKYYKTSPYYCPTCKKAWQPFGYESCDPQKQSQYLKNFPTIGCYRLKCHRCK